MSASQSTPQKPAKVMSSRLLTMKFMQRAAASSPASSAPSTPEVPSAKRQKTNGSSPAGFDADSLVDHRAIQAALAEEERIREAAIERQAAQAGDTRWVLSFENGRHHSAPPENALRVVQTGFSGIDNTGSRSLVQHDEDNGPEPPAATAGRRSFGKFNRTIEVCIMVIS
jgi:hypothetical protein